MQRCNTAEEGVAKLADVVANRRDAVFVFVSGLDAATGSMWCPDCAAADSVLHATVDRILGAAMASGRVVVYVCEIATREQWRDPANAYRKSKLRLQRIPTLVRFVHGAEVGRLVEAECTDPKLARPMSKFFSFLKATANSALDKAGDAMSQALDQLATDTMLQPQPTMSSMSPLSGTGATPWADPRRAPIIPTPAKTSPATHNRGLHTSPTTGGSTATSTQSKQEPIVGHERAPSTNEKHQQKRQVHAIGTPKLVAEPTAPTVKIAPQPLMALPSTSRKSNDSTPFFKDIFSLSAIGQLLETTPVPLTIPDDLLCGINYFAGRDLLNNYSVMITGIRKNHLRIGRRVAQAESKAPILMDRTKTEVIELHKLHQELQALPRICKAVDLMRKQIMDTAVSMQELEARVSVQCELFAADQLEGWKQQQRKKLILYKDMKREKIQDEEMSIRRDLGLPLLPSAQTHSPSPQNVEEEVTSKPSSDTNKHKKISHSHTHHQKHSHTKTGTSYKSAHKQSHSPNRVGTPQSSSKYHPTTPVSSSAPTPKPKPTTESLEKLVIEQDPYLLDKFLSHHTKTNKRKHARTSSSSDSSVSSNSDTDSHSAPDSS